MYKIVKRPDSPNLQLHIFGKRISLRTANRRLAEKKARQIEEYLILNDFRNIKPERINIIALAVKKEIELDYKNPSLARQYCKYVDWFVEYINPATFIHDITPLQLVDYFRGIGRNYTASYLRKQKRCVRLLFYYALLHNHIERDTVDGMLIHTHKSRIKTKPAKHNKPIPWEIVLQALDQAPGEYKKWWTIMAYTGLDPGDAATIQKDHVNHELKMLELRDGRSKTGEPVMIPLHDVLLNIDIVNAIPGYTPYIRNKSLFHFKNLIKSLGYEINVNYKSLRHTFNNYLNLLGISQIERAKLLGQKSTTINDVYTHGDINRLRAAINKIK